MTDDSGLGKVLRQRDEQNRGERKYKILYSKAMGGEEALIKIIRPVRVKIPVENIKRCDTETIRERLKTISQRYSKEEKLYTWIQNGPVNVHGQHPMTVYIINK